MERATYIKNEKSPLISIDTHARKATTSQSIHLMPEAFQRYSSIRILKSLTLLKSLRRPLKETCVRT
ncbi:MAG: hypothetical protein U5L09_11220 [Bacteroidales bacterium]|nr:hypothetical protein [Bacteroidales bacterium]